MIMMMILMMIMTMMTVVKTMMTVVMTMMTITMISYPCCDWGDLLQAVRGCCHTLDPSYDEEEKEQGDGNDDHNKMLAMSSDEKDLYQSPYLDI